MSARPRLTTALNQRSLVALAVGLLVFAVIAASSAWQAERNVAALRRMDRTLAAGTLLRSILLSVVEAETSQRGYLLTGQDTYLEPLNSARAALPTLLDGLDRAMIGNNDVQMLRWATEAKLAELSRTVELAQAGDRPAATAIVTTGVGRTQMERIRQLTAALASGQQSVLSKQSAAIAWGGRLLIVIDLLGLVIVLGIIAIIGVGLRAYLAALAAAHGEADAALDALTKTNERLDEMVRVRTADLTAANDEIQRFAYIVSHDLRAPLVNIMGFTSELEQSTNTLTRFAEAADWPALVREAAMDDIPEALRFIKASTSKMDRLINAILKLSREGRRTLTPERLDMRAVLEEAMAALQHQVLAKDVSVDIGPMPVLWADRIAVEQVFGNLLDNALKYLKPGRPGRIQITARTDGGLSRVAIADNGRGIAARDFERVFELFRRAGDQSVPGEGIGLAHVRALVRRLGGEIECKSTLDVGTIFTITLPHNRQADPKPSEPDSASQVSAQ